MKNPSGESGFVLVEAIAALGVAAIAAAALMTALSSASARSAEARVRMSTLRLAEALLAEGVASSSPADLELRGTLLRPKLSWTRRVEEAGDAYPGLQKITVAVSWTMQARKGTTRLEAYRIAPRS